MIYETEAWAIDLWILANKIQRLETEVQNMKQQSERTKKAVVMLINNVAPHIGTYFAQQIADALWG